MNKILIDILNDDDLFYNNKNLLSFFLYIWALEWSEREKERVELLLSKVFCRVTKCGRALSAPSHTRHHQYNRQEQNCALSLIIIIILLLLLLHQLILVGDYSILSFFLSFLVPKSQDELGLVLSTRRLSEYTHTDRHTRIKILLFLFFLSSEWARVCVCVFFQVLN